MPILKLSFIQQFYLLIGWVRCPKQHLQIQKTEILTTSLKRPCHLIYSNQTAPSEWSELIQMREAQNGGTCVWPYGHICCGWNALSCSASIPQFHTVLLLFKTTTFNSQRENPQIAAEGFQYLLHICIHKHICIYMCIHMYICIYVHIIFSSKLSPSLLIITSAVKVTISPIDISSAWKVWKIKSPLQHICCHFRRRFGGIVGYNRKNKSCCKIIGKFFSQYFPKRQF